MHDCINISINSCEKEEQWVIYRMLKYEQASQGFLKEVFLNQQEVL